MLKNSAGYLLRRSSNCKSKSEIREAARPNRKQVRCVSTSQSDQVHQCLASTATATVAGKESLRHEQSVSAEQQRLSDDQRRAARLERLDLWHSLDTIKRLGHRMARLDPLGLSKPSLLQDLTWSHSLIERLRENQSIVPTGGLLETSQPLMAVNEITNTVLNIYADNECGLEFNHLSCQEEIDWLTSEWEKLNESFHLSQIEELNLAKLLLECEAFDHFMAAKFPTTKRYGCEGAESMLAVFDEIFRLCQTNRAADDPQLRHLRAINHVIVGMPHRGRLNMLACLLDFDPSAIFNKARGNMEVDGWMAKGDVLSHLSTNVRLVYGMNRHRKEFSRDMPDPLNVSLLPNPSHLEVASPMVVGSARGRAHNLLHGYSSSPKFAAEGSNIEETKAGCGPDTEQISSKYEAHFANILPIQVHGDASLAGQGIIQETLQMSNLPRFSVGGSLHLVVNNQIGYTTDQHIGRSSRHCTDIFKLIEAPVIHVNGENISSLIKATRLALCYRQRFNKDVALNLICYRKHGHNEMDEPTFTQPLMYAEIAQRKSIPRKFCDKIQMDETKRDQITSDFKLKLQQSYEKLQVAFRPDNDNYRNFNLPSEHHRDNLFTWPTGYDLTSLREIGIDSVRTPEDFKLHPTLKRALVQDRLERFDTSKRDLASCKIDWATSELLAFGSLLHDNQTVRIAGQDVARGTFSTRHAVLFDQVSGKPFVPLNKMRAHKNKAQLEVANTILSEEAALAYEFGYSIETCSLAIWEAQFGDFFNTAQSIIDTLISSSESKWLKQSALTLLLPHGLDGAGPEHSSSHIERFLQLSSSSFDSIDTEAKCNWSICFPTLPSQYFHLLRRQVLRPFRKPLIVMSPKVIFRHKDCQSELAEFGPSTCFQPVLDDPQVRDPQSVDTLVLCSGKVYFTLKEIKERLGMKNVALVRIEELCPFPIKQISDILKRYESICDENRIVWFQEEHRNQGCYSFVEARLANMLSLKPRYIGRPESELPATGSSSAHKEELGRILAEFESLKS